ncbi:hypothetical protein [Methanosarcina sp. KYL-1]|uniref:hypothetical protein n=1 Tax=Methanosarcina sp. KYL-1 TaxID=2602068 RepID=UPI00210133D5|nr:hypothetical protein [Methanosarcina sp. KYL-1]
MASLATFDIITAKKSSGETKITFSKLKPGPMEDYEKVPIKLHFGDDTVTVDDGSSANEYRISESTFKITGGDYTEVKTCGDCSSYKGCNVTWL